VGAGDGGVIALIQRVTEARVRIDGRVVGEIGAGLLALVCAERGDAEREADALLAKLLGYRVFADAAGKMNLSLRDTGGGLLLVSQFTLAADTNSGTRPSFTPAAPPEVGARLFAHFVAQARRAHAPVASGEFGAMMRVELTNDGPVTFWLQVEPKENPR
jgi:D-tyrosyl-tRNA(Tyr) deacylase